MDVPARPIFIVGPGRSGTTLLRSILSSHGRVCVTPETHFFDIARRAGWRPGSRDGRRVWAAYRDHRRFHELGLNPADVERLVAGSWTPRAVLAAILEAYRQAQGRPVVGEKTPRHWQYLDVIADWFPNMRVVVVQRDPRASGASQLATPWVANRLVPVSLRHGLVSGKRRARIVGDASAWSRLHRTIRDDWQGDSRVHVVSYETLTRDPAGTLTTLCRFLDLPFDPGMIDARSGGAVNAPRDLPDWGTWRTAHHERARSAIAPSEDRWRTVLTPSEVAAIEGQCGAQMEAMGYRCVTGPARRRRAAAAGRALRWAVRAERRIRRSFDRAPS